MEIPEIIDLAEKTANSILGVDRFRNRGLLAPVGLALNEVAVGWTSATDDSRRWLLPTDLATLDLGLNVDGHAIETAFSFSFDAMHDELLQVVREATNTGIRLAGIDAPVDDIGAQVAEVLDAGQVHMPDGKVRSVRAVTNLTGDFFAWNQPNNSRNSLPLFRGQRSGRRMKPGELWVVDAYGSVGGCGHSRSIGPPRYFNRPKSYDWRPEHELMGEDAKELTKFIEANFFNFVFCERWLTQEADKQKLKKPKDWVEEGLKKQGRYMLIARNDAMADLPGSHVARFAHSVLIGSKRKEVLTRGLDF